MNPKLVHTSYHKCLTVYFSRVLGGLYNRTLPLSRGFKHFNSRIDDFYREAGNYRVASVNNRALDLDRLGLARVSRFIRDPRDLVVSGYFYHRRGAEPWCNVVSPGESDWATTNGNPPTRMGRNQSFAEYLRGLSEEDGLLAEAEYRKHHFASMLRWPADNGSIRTYRYENIVGNEETVFRDLFSFYGVSWPERFLGLRLARKFAAGRQSGSTAHIRDPKPAQWRKYFTPRISAYFAENYGAVVQRYDYSPD